LVKAAKERRNVTYKLDRTGLTLDFYELVSGKFTLKELKVHVAAFEMLANNMADLVKERLGNMGAKVNRTYGPSPNTEIEGAAGFIRFHFQAMLVGDVQGAAPVVTDLSRSSGFGTARPTR